MFLDLFLDLILYRQKEKFWTKEQCAGLKMDMPLNPKGLNECEKNCDDRDKCNAIEYDDASASCIYLECQDPVPEPTSDVAIGNTEYHPGGSYNYVAYARRLIIRKNKGTLKYIDRH